MPEDESDPSVTNDRLRPAQFFAAQTADANTLLQNSAAHPSLRRLQDLSKNAAILYSNLDQELQRSQKSPNALPANDLLLRLVGTRATLWSQTYTLFSAIEQGQFVTVRDLIQTGANINHMRDAHSMTALHLACRTSSTRPHDVDLLIHDGNADVTLKDDQGRTSLHYAVEMPFPDIEIARSLLEAGAQVDATDDLGVTPWKLASANKEGTKIFELLRKPPLVQGPSASGTLTIFKQPHSQLAREACDCFQMIATEIFLNRATTTEKHLSRFFSVSEAIYGNTTLEQRLDDTRSSSVSDDLVCRWYHLPANNMAWIEDLFRNRFQMLPKRWSEQFRDSKWPHGRCINTHTMQYTAESGESVLALCLPYISYEDNVNHSSMSAFIKEEMQAGPTQFIGSNRTGDVALHRSEELLFRAYLQHTPPLHVRRTLDQWLYYMLPDTMKRDTDQMVTRWARDWLNHPRHNILMVDQLWLWVIKGDKTKNCPDTVISCFPNREGHESASLDDLKRSVLNGDVESRDPIVKIADLVSRITAVCCGVFEWTSESEMVHFYEMFAATVGRASDQETQLLQGFKRRSEELHLLSEKYRYHWKERNRLLVEMLDIRPQTRLLEEVKDVCDEIDIILHVSREQRRALESYHIGAFFDRGRESQIDVTMAPLVEKPLQIISQTIANFQSLQQQIRDVQAGLKDLLDLQQKQATVWEARSTRDRARSASRQGNVIVVFTTVTIIFLPLSFMASLFAVSIDVFPEAYDHDGLFKTQFSSNLISLYFGIAVAIILPFVATAFSTHWIAKQYHRLLNACLIPLAIGTLHLLSTLVVAGIAKWSKRSIKRLKVHRREYYGYRFTTNFEVANKSFLYDQSPLGLPSGGSEAPSHSGSERRDRRGSLLGWMRARGKKGGGSGDGTV